MRVRFDNTFGSVPLVIDAASAGLHGGGGSLVEGSERPLSFGGQPAVTVPVGAPMLSDPVELHVPDLAELAVSVHLPGPTPGTSLHSLGQQTAYVSAPGEYTLKQPLPDRVHDRGAVLPVGHRGARAAGGGDRHARRLDHRRLRLEHRRQRALAGRARRAPRRLRRRARPAADAGRAASSTPASAATAC